MEIDYNEKHWSNPCPKYDCRKDTCKCGLSKVTLPAVLGDDSKDSPIAPKNGDYCNTIVLYEANGHIYIYTAEGIPMSVGVGRDALLVVEKELESIQQEIDDLRNSPDVVDIVPTYAALQAYDTSRLGDNDIIRVLQDETHDGQSTYYRWDASTSSWTYIGAVGAYYTKSQVDALLANKQNILAAGNNISISGNVISATDTTYSDFVGTDGADVGISGLVPAPAAADANKFLKSDGTWSVTGGGGGAYAAGNAISIDQNNVISAAIYPEDFFTANATVTGTGSEIALQKTLPVKLVNVELDGDTEQQTYSGKNLWSFDTGTFTNNSGSAQTQTHTDTSLTLTAIGTNGAQFVTWITPELDDTKTYTISGKAKKVVNGTDGQPYIRVTYSYSDDGTTWADNSNAYDNTSPIQGEEYTFSYTLPSGHKYYRVRCYNNTSTPVTIGEQTTYYDLQLEASATATSYEPYVGGIPAPNPDYPQNIHVVTGEQTVTVSDGTNSQSYTVNLGTTELCKIGDYQDYIYKSGNDWFVHKTTGKVTLTGDADEAWSAGNNNVYFFHVVDGAYQPENRSTIATILCDYYAPRTYNQVASTTIDYGVALDSNNAGRLAIRNKDCANSAALKTWLASNNTTVYYPLATPTDTKITDAGLIAQLDALMDAKTYSDLTNITVTATSTNLSAILGVAAYRNSLSGIIDSLGELYAA